MTLLGKIVLTYVNIYIFPSEHTSALFSRYTVRREEEDSSYYP